MEFDVPIQKVSQDRYLTYALSVVSDRALPDVRDGLKPVQRRILYAMFRNLGLKPDRPPRKSAAVVGEVLARYHPHGDQACYDAMVRMAQDFSLRYPLVEGQGNFGSLDGDAAAAYRYTEARLRPIALEVLGEIDEETVRFKDNFDATTLEPEVLPSRIPNLLVNGASGIAVGMATNIPPHNLKDVVRTLLALSEDSEISNAKLTALIKGPDFPTGCLVLNSKKSLEEIYRSGRGSIKMRGEWSIEEGQRGKQAIIITTIPFVVNKAQLVERIASLIIDRKVPQLVDVRDESTDDIRVVLELASGADAEAAMAYLFKHTSLESSFAVNLTALVPSETTALRPTLLSLRECLQFFLDFRLEVVEKRLRFELRNLERRIHILDGLVIVFNALDEALKIIRASKGRADSAALLIKRFGLTEEQSIAVVDMRIYQLSRTNIGEVREELKEKQARVDAIKTMLKSEAALLGLVRQDLKAVSEDFGERRRCRIDSTIEEVELKDEDYLVNEDVYALITQDGWLKRIRQTNDYSSTRVREGDALVWALPASTLDYVVFFSNLGVVYSLRVIDFPSSSGFGTPVQKLLKFSDGETIIASYVYSETEQHPSLQNGNAEKKEFLSKSAILFAVSEGGLGSAFDFGPLVPTKRNGKRVIKLRDDDRLVAVQELFDQCLLLTQLGQGVRIRSAEVPKRDGPSLGVSLIGLNEKKSDKVVAIASLAGRSGSVVIALDSGKEKEVNWVSIELTKRGLRGQKIIAAGKVTGVRIA
jgi:DNA gyrase subunit A